MRPLKILLISLCLFLQVASMAQPNWEKTSAKHSYNTSNEFINFLRFSQSQRPSIKQWEAEINSFYQLSDSYEFKMYKIQKDEIGFKHYRYQLYYLDIPIDGAELIAHTTEGNVASFNGEIYLNNNSNIDRKLSFDAAVSLAKTKLNCNTAKWEIKANEIFIKRETGDTAASFYPKEFLTFYLDPLDSKAEMRLCYKIDFYSESPFFRKWVYVDVNNGEIIQAENRIHETNVVGTTVTKYAGTQKFDTDSVSSTRFRLRETVHGKGINTYDLNTSTNYSNAVDFTDSNNYWNNKNVNKDEIAGDVHWATQKTYEYYKSYFNRNSIDNQGHALNSYLHFSSNYANAFWDGSRMTYGDGNSSVDPLTTIDIVAHEITHGLTTNTANLVYSYESGALNESFSDIFSIAVEFLYDSIRSDWTLGEDVISGGIRNVKNPNAKGDPDTYKGTYWHTASTDHGGVHTNSGVQNYWFYLLSEGGSGTNDNGDKFNVSGIGIRKAMKIAYRNLTYYLTKNSQYHDARKYAIESAIDLYGDCSPEEIATVNAWHAVGVGSSISTLNQFEILANQFHFCDTPSVASLAISNDRVKQIKWTLSDGQSSDSLKPNFTLQQFGALDLEISLTFCDGSKDSLKSKDLIIVAKGLGLCDTFLMPKTGQGNTLTNCFGTLFDNGGTNNYSNNSDGISVINPQGHDTLILVVNSFLMVPGDYIDIYDDTVRISSKLVGRYSSDDLKEGDRIYLPSGSALIRQISNYQSHTYGFEFSWKTVAGLSPPIAKFDIIDSSVVFGDCANFIDVSSPSGDNYWRFGDGETSIITNPKHYYRSSGIFQVSMISTNCIASDTSISKNITIEPKPSLVLSQQQLIDSLNSGEVSTNHLKLTNPSDGELRVSVSKNPNHHYTSCAPTNDFKITESDSIRILFLEEGTDSNLIVLKTRITDSLHRVSIKSFAGKDTLKLKDLIEKTDLIISSAIITQSGESIYDLYHEIMESYISNGGGVIYISPEYYTMNSVIQMPIDVYNKYDSGTIVTDSNSTISGKWPNKFSAQNLRVISGTHHNLNPLAVIEGTDSVVVGEYKKGKGVSVFVGYPLIAQNDTFLSIVNDLILHVKYEYGISKWLAVNHDTTYTVGSKESLSIPVIFNASNRQSEKYVDQIYLTYNDSVERNIPVTCTMHVSEKPFALFSVSNDSTSTGEVQFRDHSLNYPDKYLWLFGDGASSNEKNPRHTYFGYGDYDVTLIVFKGNLSDTLVKSNYVHYNWLYGEHEIVLLPTNTTATTELCRGIVYSNGGPFSSTVNPSQDTLIIQPSGANKIRIKYDRYYYSLNRDDYFEIFTDSIAKNSLYKKWSGLDGFPRWLDSFVTLNTGKIYLVFSGAFNRSKPRLKITYESISNAPVAPKLIVNSDSTGLYNHPIDLKSNASENILKQKWEFGDGQYSNDKVHSKHRYVESRKYKYRSITATCYSIDTSDYNVIKILSPPELLLSKTKFVDSLNTGDSILYSYWVKNNGKGPGYFSTLSKIEQQQKLKRHPIKTLYITHDYNSPIVLNLDYHLKKLQITPYSIDIFQSLDTNTLNQRLFDYDVVIYNNYHTKSPELYSKPLKTFLENGGNLLILGGTKQSFDSLDLFQCKKMTTINYDWKLNADSHPLLAELDSTYTDINTNFEIEIEDSSFLSLITSGPSNEYTKYGCRAYGRGKLVYSAYYFNLNEAFNQTLFKNTFNWFSKNRKTINFLVDSYDATIAPQDSAKIDVMVSAVNLKQGDYLDSIYFETNDLGVQEHFFYSNLHVSSKVGARLIIDSIQRCEKKIIFNDKSVNEPISWLWDFGDGAYSKLQNPSHIYEKDGLYDITLIVSNSFSSDTLTIKKAVRINSKINKCDDIILEPFRTITTSECSGSFHSNGGPKSYPLSAKDTIVIAPIGRDTLNLEFTEWSLPYGTRHLRLKVFDEFLTSDRIVLDTLLKRYDTKGLKIDVSSGKAIITFDRYIPSNFYALHFDYFTMNWSSKTGSTGLTPAFTVSDSNLMYREIIYFKNSSVGEPRLIKWDFGDGSTSFGNETSHKYSKSDTFSITLSLENCIDQKSISKKVVVAGRPVLNFSPKTIIDTLPSNSQKTTSVKIYNIGSGPGTVKNRIKGIDSLNGIIVSNAKLSHNDSNLIRSIKNQTNKMKLDVEYVYSSGHFTSLTYEKDFAIFPTLIYDSIGLFTRLEAGIFQFLKQGGTVIILGQSEQNLSNLFATKLLDGFYVDSTKDDVTNTTINTLNSSLPKIFKVAGTNYTFVVKNSDAHSFQRVGVSDIGVTRKIGFGNILLSGFTLDTFSNHQDSMMSNIGHWIIENSRHKTPPDWLNIDTVNTVIEANDSFSFNIKLDANKTQKVYNSFSHVIEHNDTIPNPSFYPISMRLDDSNDASVISIGKINNGCELDSFKVSATIKNAKTSIIKKFTAHYSVNATHTDQMSVTTTLKPEEEYNISFPAKLLSTYGKHEIKLWVDLDFDYNHANDTITSTFSSFKNPTFDLINHGSSSKCLGDSIRLRPDDANLSYFWSNFETTRIIFAKSSGKYFVIGTNSHGCSDTSKTVELTFNPNPQPIIVAPEGKLICVGSPVKLYAPKGYTTYNWADIGYRSNSTLVYSKGDYYVTVKDSNGCYGKSNIIYIDRDATKPPTITSSLSDPCEGNTVVLQANPKNLTNYKWSNGSTIWKTDITKSGDYSCTTLTTKGCELTSAVYKANFKKAPTPVIKRDGYSRLCQGDTVTISVVNQYDSYLWSNGEKDSSIKVTDDGDYFVTVKEGIWCRANSDTFHLKFNSIPDVKIASNSDECCTYDSVFLFAKNPNIYESFHWNNGSLDSAFYTNDFGNYQLKAVDTNGCWALSNNIHLTELETPKPEIINLGRDTICQKEKTRLTLTFNYSKHLWNNNSTKPTLEVDSSYKAVVTVTSQDGCVGTSAPYFVHQRSEINSAIDPFGSVDLCEGETILIKVIDSTNNVRWSHNKSIETKSTVLSDPGQYWAELSDVNGCTTLSDTVDISLVHFPTSNFNIQQNSQSISAINSSENADRFKWFINDVLISKSLDLVHQFDSSGDYVLTLIAANKCYEDTIHKTLNISHLSIGKIALIENASIAPNPTNGISTLRFKSHQLQNANVLVIDYHGKIISRDPIRSALSMAEFQIDMSNRPSGIYTVAIESEGAYMFTTRLVKF